MVARQLAPYVDISQKWTTDFRAQFNAALRRCEVLATAIKEQTGENVPIFANHQDSQSLSEITKKSLAAGESEDVTDLRQELQQTQDRLRELEAMLTQQTQALSSNEKVAQVSRTISQAAKQKNLQRIADLREDIVTIKSAAQSRQEVQRQKIKDLQQTKSEQNEYIAELQRNLRRAEKELDDVEPGQQRMQEKLRIADEQVRKAERQMAKTAKDNVTLENKVAQLERELQKLSVSSGKALDRRSEVEGLLNARQALEFKQKKEIDRLNSKIQQMNAVLPADLVKDLSKVQSEFDAQNQKIDDMGAQIGQLRGLYEMQGEDMVAVQDNRTQLIEQIGNFTDQIEKAGTLEEVREITDGWMLGVYKAAPHFVMPSTKFYDNGGIMLAMKDGTYEKANLNDPGLQALIDAGKSVK